MHKTDQKSLSAAVRDWTLQSCLP